MAVAGEQRIFRPRGGRDGFARIGRRGGRPPYGCLCGHSVHIAQSGRASEKLTAMSSLGFRLRPHLICLAFGIDQTVGTVATPTNCRTCVPFMNQIATLPLVSEQVPTVWTIVETGDFDLRYVRLSRR
jgi:hypothetical protein